MAERSDRLTFRADLLPRIAVEAAFGVAAATMLHAAAPALGLRVMPGPWFVLCLGLAHLALGWLASGRATGRESGGMLRIAGLSLAGLLVLLPLGEWLRGAALAGATMGQIALGLSVVVAAFCIAAAVAGIVFSSLPAARGDAALQLSLPGSPCGIPAASRGAAATRRGPAVLASSMMPVEPTTPAMSIATRVEESAPAGHRGAAGHASDWIDVDHLPADWLETSGARREGPAAAAVRRVFDILMAGGLVLATLPVLVLTAIAIRLETPGPVFYRQERVGRDGRVFTLFKFRSMTVDAEANGAVWAMPKDPRVTRVGRFIRLTRIDEVPQVLNVLRGEMAFIGPRPERPVFVAQLERAIPRYADRTVVKPGITGWAQVRYRYGASVEDARMKLGYDLYYIRHRSLTLDMRILLGTVRVVLLQEGAR